MKYTSGSVKKGRRTYYYIKNTETGQIESQCTKYLKHKVMQNRAANTVIRIAGILPFYMDFLADRDLTLSYPYQIQCLLYPVLPTFRPMK